MKILYLFICLFLFSCAGKTNDFNIIGFTKEEQQIIIDAANEWCNAGVGCISFDGYGENIIELHDKVGTKEHPNRTGMCRFDNDNYLIYEKNNYVEIKIEAHRELSYWKKHLRLMVMHEFGHFLTVGKPEHLPKGNIMYKTIDLKVKSLTKDDIQWGKDNYSNTFN